eukprot:246402-Chlamydomonas_euryale.AAC.4
MLRLQASPSSSLSPTCSLPSSLPGPNRATPRRQPHAPSPGVPFLLAFSYLFTPFRPARPQLIPTDPSRPQPIPTNPNRPPDARAGFTAFRSAARHTCRVFPTTTC